MESDADLKVIAQEAAQLLAGAIDKLVAGATTASKELGPPTEPRLFFPNGIELIYLKFKVATVDIALAITGKEAPIKVPTIAAATSLAERDGGWVSSG